LAFGTITMTNEQIVEIEKLPVKIKQLLNLAVFKSTLRVLDQEKYKEYFPIAKAIEYCVLENKNVFDYDCMKNRQNRQSRERDPTSKEIYSYFTYYYT
jgi:hypothetical protein